MTTESHEFKAEIQQLLNILVHSLYTERDIFLRELISNASDALSRVQFELLTNRDVLDPDAELKIVVECDKDAKTITVRDTGIGLTRDEMVENLGTIAHSGAAEFMKRLQAEKKPADVIGQFGVGFYSVYMVADEVTVTSRSYRPDAQAVEWTSKGDNTYTLADVEKADRGTVITVKLKEDAAEYAEDWKLEQIIKKHSDFVSFPIYVKDKAVNRQTALWRQSPREVTAEQYDEFYKHLTLDFDAPLTHVHLVADVPVDVHAILYVPAKRERGIFSLRKDDGLKLYSRKILISEYFKDLLPQYFRFIQGVVDSEDLPLNVSREAIQNNRAAAKLKSTLTHKIATELADLGEKTPPNMRILERIWPVHQGRHRDGRGQSIGSGEAAALQDQSRRGRVGVASASGRSVEARSNVDLLHPGRRSHLRGAQPAPRLLPPARSGSGVSGRADRQFHDVDAEGVRGQEIAERRRCGAGIAQRRKTDRVEGRERRFCATGGAHQDHAGRSDHRSARVQTADRQPVPPGLAQRRNRSRHAAGAAHAGPGL